MPLRLCSRLYPAVLYIHLFTFCFPSLWCAFAVTRLHYREFIVKHTCFYGNKRLFGRKIDRARVSGKGPTLYEAPVSGQKFPDPHDFTMAGQISLSSIGVLCTVRLVPVCMLQENFSLEFFSEKKNFCLGISIYVIASVSRDKQRCCHVACHTPGPIAFFS